MRVLVFFTDRLTFPTLDNVREDVKQTREAARYEGSRDQVRKARHGLTRTFIITNGVEIPVAFHALIEREDWGLRHLGELGE